MIGYMLLANNVQGIKYVTNVSACTYLTVPPVARVASVPDSDSQKPMSEKARTLWKKYPEIDVNNYFQCPMQTHNGVEMFFKCPAI